MTRGITFAGAAILAAACGPAEENGPGITLVNQTRVSLTYFAVEATSLIDPVPTLPRDAFADRIVAPHGAAPVVNIAGYDPGDDVLFFLYVVSADGQTADLAADTVVTSAQIVMNRGYVVVSRLE